MTTLRSRIEQLEDEQWRQLAEELDGYFLGRSFQDVEFFCAHGYLPEVPLPGPSYALERLNWTERWKTWKKFQRHYGCRSIAEREFFCVHGYWPSRAKGRGDGNV
jgi:hypothetical protein